MTCICFLVRLLLMCLRRLGFVPFALRLFCLHRRAELKRRGVGNSSSSLSQVLQMSGEGELRNLHANAFSATEVDNLRQLSSRTPKAYKRMGNKKRAIARSSFSSSCAIRGGVVVALHQVIERDVKVVGDHDQCGIIRFTPVIFVSAQRVLVDVQIHRQALLGHMMFFSQIFQSHRLTSLYHFGIIKLSRNGICLIRCTRTRFNFITLSAYDVEFIVYWVHGRCFCIRRNVCGEAL